MLSNTDSLLTKYPIEKQSELEESFTFKPNSTYLLCTKFGTLEIGMPAIILSSEVVKNDATPKSFSKIFIKVE